MFAKSKPALTEEDRTSSEIRVLSPETFQEETDPDIEPAAQDSHTVNQPSGGTCVGELVLDPRGGPADLIQVLQDLEKHLKAQIVSVEPRAKGFTVTLTCAVQDMVTFLGMLPNLTVIKEWSFDLN